MTYHEQYMALALEQARLALTQDEVPVGAVLVREGRVIASAYNQMRALHDPTAHAEMLALRQAATVLPEGQRLTDCTLYVTLEPCPMCAGAIVNAKVGSLIFGAYDARAGAAGTLYAITTDSRLNHRLETHGGVLDAQCAALLREFFQERREGL